MALTLPDTANLGDTGHISDHNLITTALGSLETSLGAKAPSASPTFTGTVALPATTTLDGVTLTTGGGLTYITKADFSSAATVSVNGCFTAAYANYRIIVSDSSSSASTNYNLRLRVSAADDSNAAYNYAFTGLGSDGGSWTVNGGNATSVTLGYNSNGGIIAGAHVALDIHGPQLAAKTYGLGHATQVRGGTDAAFVVTSGGFQFQNTTQFDGFTIYPGSGTFTGTVRVYGYRNS